MTYTRSISTAAGGGALAAGHAPLNAGQTPPDVDLTLLGSAFVFDVREVAALSVQAYEISGGAWNSGVLTLSMSNDGARWHDLQPSAVTLSADGMTDSIDATGFAYLMVRVTTKASSGTPRLRVIVSGKGD